MRWSEWQHRFAQSMLQPEFPFAADPDGLALYRNTILLTLTDALREQFRAIGALTGDAFFASLAHRMITAHPPESGNLNDYGAKLPEYIEQDAACHSLPYLADVARFEHAWHRSFFAEDDSALGRDDETMNPAALLDDPSLHVRHGVQILRLRYPADAIWRYCVVEQGQGDAPGVQSGDYRLLLYRPDHRVRAERIDAAMFEGLLALEQGATLHGATLAYLQNTSEDAVAFLTFVLQRSLLTRT